ncbi:GntR family transcriptional regulator [Pseudoponticoccus marisrubri]|uniref:GntR family transcriptional regulator n=1 Tax=Pseudoponticoccus marisrubri TaxID=1685382 RepID=A0A0W7WP40_9RHOB|nr:GntR family transcriptional regulator [Pseudoponticoccus marisrubri]KUF12305.1 GntR family transcriptional regulator [Pseudoponticoccus marisrubri]
MQPTLAPERRTTVDEIFNHLYGEISAMRLRPGDRISEAEIAAQFSVSRQPVRDAFTRLANLDLLLIRPQRATEVKRFSAREIEKSRFVRAAVESEVLRRATRNFRKSDREVLGACLDRQRAAIADGDYERFGKLDYEFHRTLCEIAGVDFAFEVISSEKAKVDRLCMLGLAKEDRMPQLLQDHEAITEAIADGDEARAVEAGMLHLSRLDATIETITATNANYFEPDRA